MGWFGTSNPAYQGPPPPNSHGSCETLFVVSHPTTGQKTINRLDHASGRTIPVWFLHRDPSNRKCLSLSYANADANGGGAPVGSIRKRTFTGRLEIVLRGSISFEMELMPDYPVQKHGFSPSGGRGGPAYIWAKNDKTLSDRELYFKDANTGQVLGRFMTYPDGRRAGARPTFDLYVPPESLDMDMFITTGIAASDYWRTGGI